MQEHSLWLGGLDVLSVCCTELDELPNYSGCPSLTCGNIEATFQSLTMTWPWDSACKVGGTAPRAHLLQGVVPTISDTSPRPPKVDYNG